MTFEIAGKLVPRGLKWLGMLLLVAVIVGGVYAYGEQQFSRGEKAESARWLARENADLAAANAEIARLTLEKQAAEKAHQARLAAAATQFEKERGREKRKTDAVLADLRAGHAGLFYRADGGESAGACGTGQVVAAAGGGDGGATARLPGAVAEFLYSEADRADEIVRQLQLCQQVVIEDRRLCGQ